MRVRRYLKTKLCHVASVASPERIVTLASVLDVAPVSPTKTISARSPNERVVTFATYYEAMAKEVPEIVSAGPTAHNVITPLL